MRIRVFVYFGLVLGYGEYDDYGTGHTWGNL